MVMEQAVLLVMEQAFLLVTEQAVLFCLIGNGTSCHWLGNKLSLAREQAVFNQGSQLSFWLGNRLSIVMEQASVVRKLV